jgi:ribosomal protein L32
LPSPRKDRPRITFARNGSRICKDQPAGEWKIRHRISLRAGSPGSDPTNPLYSTDAIWKVASGGGTAIRAITLK